MGSTSVFFIRPDGVLYTDASAPSKDYNLTITVVGGGASASVEITVTVQ